MLECISGKKASLIPAQRSLKEDGLWPPVFSERSVPGVTQKSPGTLQTGLNIGSQSQEAGHRLDTVVGCTYDEPEITVTTARIERSGACF